MTRRWTESGLPGNARARGGLMAAAAELRRDFVDIHFSLLERRLMRVNSGSSSSKTQATTTGSMARM